MLLTSFLRLLPSRWIKIGSAFLCPVRSRQYRHQGLAICKRSCRRPRGLCRVAFTLRLRWRPRSLSRFLRLRSGCWLSHWGTIGQKMRGSVKHVGAMPASHPALGDFELIGNDLEHRAATRTACNQAHLAQYCRAHPDENARRMLMCKRLSRAQNSATINIQPSFSACT